MKRFALVFGTLLLILSVVVVGCSTSPSTTSPGTKAPAASTPAATTPPNVNVTEGAISSVNATTGTVTVETPSGIQTVAITKNTEITLNGQSCTIDKLGSLDAAGQDFTCTVVTDESGNVLSVDVQSVPVIASVRGTISDVNIKDSTVTVKTGSGDVVYDVDPTTGLLIGGVACSLQLIDELVAAGGNLPCTVIYNVDDKGAAQYIDISNPPNLTQGVGTVTSVDIVKSTVTLQTDKGPRTFTTNAKPGEFLNG